MVQDAAQGGMVLLSEATKEHVSAAMRHMAPTPFRLPSSMVKLTFVYD